MKQSLPAVALVAASLALAGCGDARGSAGSVAVRDSAGIRLVESTGPAWEEGGEWRVSPEPALRIGVVEGDPAYQFGEVAGAVRLPGGGVAVADRQSGDVRYYDARGRHTQTVGRKGEGPGEFTRIDWMEPVGDSLAVGDRGASRVTVLAPGGAVQRTLTMADDTSGRRPRPLAPLPGGDVLAMLGPSFDPSRLGSGARDSVTYLRQPADGAAPVPLGRFPGPERLIRVSGNSISITDLPFGRRDHVAAWGEGFYYGSADAPEVGRYDGRGRLLQLVRWDGAPREVTPADVERFRARALDGAAPAARTEMQRTLAELPFPETMPAYDDVRVDRGGHLWVREYAPAGEGPVRWRVFDPEGRLLGPVTLPERFRVTDIGADYVLGVWRDDLDVEQVHLYRLDRTGG